MEGSVNKHSVNSKDIVFQVSFLPCVMLGFAKIEESLRIIQFSSKIPENM